MITIELIEFVVIIFLKYDLSSGRWLTREHQIIHILDHTSVRRYRRINSNNV